MFIFTRKARGGSQWVDLRPYWPGSCNVQHRQDWWNKKVLGEGKVHWTQWLSWHHVPEWVPGHLQVNSISPTNTGRQEKAIDDPLWHSCSLLQHFQLNCATIMVPLGSSALDEVSCQTKGQTHAKSYMPNKSMRKYGIWFYCVVGAREMYCQHSFWDNRSGNRLLSVPGER